MLFTSSLKVAASVSASILALSVVIWLIALSILLSKDVFSSVEILTMASTRVFRSFKALTLWSIWLSAVALAEAEILTFADTAEEVAFTFVRTLPVKFIAKAG